MNTIISKLCNLPKFQEYITKIEEKNSQIAISGLSDVGKIQYIYATKESTNRPICIVTYNEIQAKKIVEDLKYFVNDFEQILYFPKKEIVTYDYVAESKDLPYARIEVLNKIEKNKAKIIVTTIEALMQKMIAKSTLYRNKLELKVGKNYSLEGIKQTLISLGYERNDLVENKGEFSVRGDILDIALSNKEGIRIEFWGDEIDSIRRFNLSSQRSNDMLEKIEIMPAHEFILEDELSSIAQKIREGKFDFKDEIEGKIPSKQKQEYKSKIEEMKSQDIELIESGDYISKVDKYFNYFYTKQETFVDYLGKDFIIMFDELSKIKQREENILIDNRNLMKALLEKEKYIPHAIQNIQNIQNIEYIREDKQIIYLEKQDFGISKSANIKYNFNYRDVKYYKSEIELLIGDLIKWINSKKEVIILAGNEEETEKFIKLLEEKEIPYRRQNIEQINLNEDLRKTYEEARVLNVSGNSCDW